MRQRGIADRMTDEERYTLAMAIGRDTGNRSMRAADRKAWNVDDWNAAAEIVNRLLKIDSTA